MYVHFDLLDLIFPEIGNDVVLNVRYTYYDITTRS